MFTPVEARFGIQPIAFVNVPNTTLQSGQTPFANQEHPLGTIIRAYDPIYGEGEFIYLQMVASTAVGSWVTYGAYGTTTPSGATGAEFLSALMPAIANTAQPVAIAMAAFPAGSPTFALGWFQIAGAAVAADNGTLTGSPAVIYAAGSGQVTTLATGHAGMEIMNARAITNDGTPVAGLFLAQINRPFMQGAIT
jgi:hypothetical protein